MMDERQIRIPPITLEWSDWFAWPRLALDARTDPAGVRVPNSPGIYEVRLTDRDDRLTIGKASNLRMRVKQGLVKDKVPHSSGRDIRTCEDVTRVLIRWAVTDRPAAVEEELHLRHKAAFGRLPKYTDRT